MLNFLAQPSTSRFIIGVIFIGAGVLHFIKPGFYIRIMPDYIPYHKLMVYISGMAEILGGAGVLIPSTRSIAAWGLILLLIAVFPANIDMSLQAIKHQGWRSLYTTATLVRLPLQLILMYWVYWACIQP